jgi:hypothetical protein
MEFGPRTLLATGRLYAKMPDRKSVSDGLNWLSGGSCTVTDFGSVKRESRP